MKLKTEHAGAKNGGGYWGKREEAKRRSAKARRVVDKATAIPEGSLPTAAEIEAELKGELRRGTGIKIAADPREHGHGG